MQEISVSDFKKMIDAKEDYQLIDVREEHECEICTLYGLHIPMAEVMNNIDKIARDKKVIVHCRSGKRSAAVIQALETQHSFTNLLNLKGGILAWADEIDSSMAKY